MKTCDGCAALCFERWPKGAYVAKCTSVPEQMQHTPGGHRVIEYSASKGLGSVRRPAWCSRKMNHADAARKNM